MRPLISIIVLNFNRVNETAFTIEHLVFLKGQRPDIEIIAVDNASSDETWDFLKEQADHVKIMRMSSNIGIEAINRACEKALGEYVLVLDDDSHPVDKACLDRIAEIFDSEEKVGIIACRIESASGKRVREWHIPDVDEYCLSPAFIGCGFAIRRDLFRLIDWFPADFFLYQNEIEVAIRARLAGYEIVFDPACRVVHRFVPAGRTNARRVLYPTRNSIWLIRKYFSFPVSFYLLFGRMIFGLLRAFEGRELGVYFKALKEGFGARIRKQTLKRSERKFAVALIKQNSILHHAFKGL